MPDSKDDNEGETLLMPDDKGNNEDKWQLYAENEYNNGIKIKRATRVVKTTTKEEFQVIALFDEDEKVSPECSIKESYKLKKAARYYAKAKKKYTEDQ